MIFLGIVVTLFALFLLSVLRLFLSRFVHRPFDQVIPFLRYDDSAAMAELFSVPLEKYLREALSHGQFRKEQLNRIRLAHERIECRAHNVTVIQEWADTELSKARVTGDEEIRAIADKLVVACAMFRMAVSAVQTRMRIWQVKILLMPSARIPRLYNLRKVDDVDLFLSYETIKETALKLAELCGGDCQERLLEAL